ncbi:hypothetical protein HZS38_12145 [Xenorhabdus nematophila]|uniref:Uncharacterized protein n=2 Tax=Xenorhabdus TaxID=626 RepID=A0A077PMB2_XENBV|nr:hypothetical protein [Xenorhabdus nematophila]MBA0019864.1 hypothetical protein [Xenorhabdus nematophila]CBJ88901.1 hypothetical protein XNC1_0830 [Xenorhabdus nematophila ATCC 19061]CDH21707.1 hypothetical protein XBKQ1_620010 [Xenorhabdus bovienii str. kraussei Quebec]CEK21811.1 hypothetical protein XNC2_0815 [Xenorhabdus nematophila AN6/1]
MWLSRREPIIIRLFFCCGVTFSGKPAKSDALTPQTVKKVAQALKCQQVQKIPQDEVSNSSYALIS